MPPKYPNQPGKPKIHYDGNMYEKISTAYIPPELDDEEAKEQLKSFYSLEDNIRLDVLEEVIRDTAPDFRITRNDRNAAVRAQRRQVMNAAQDVIINIALEKRRNPGQPEVRALARPYTGFLLRDGSNESNARNEEFFQLVKENDPDKLGEFFYTGVLDAVKTLQENAFTAEAVLDMDDAQFVEKFSQVIPAYERVLELESIISGANVKHTGKIPKPLDRDGNPQGSFETDLPSYNMSEEQLKQLKSFRSMMDQLSLAKARLDMLSSPYYEVMDLGKLLSFNSDDLAEKYYQRCTRRDLEAPEPDDISNSVELLSSKLYNYNIFYGNCLSADLSKKMREDGIDPATAFCYTRFGAELESSKLNAAGETLLLGDPIIAATPDNRLRLYSFDGKNMHAASLTASLDSLADSFDGAKLFLRGSAEFSNMHKAVKDLQELSKKVKEPLSAEDATQLRNAAAAVKQDARRYIWYKGNTLEQDVGATILKTDEESNDYLKSWDTFNFQNANSNEIKRLQAAKRAFALANSLDCAMEKMFSPKRVTENEEVLNKQKAVENKVKPQEVAAPTDPDAVTSEQLNDAVAEFSVAATPPQELKDKDNIAHNLHVEVCANLQAVFDSAAERAKKSGKSTVELTEAEKEIFKETLAKALVLNQINKGQFAPFNDPNKSPAEIRKAIDDNVRSVVERKEPTHGDPLTPKRALGILNGGPNNLLSVLASRAVTGKDPKGPAKDDFAIAYGHKPLQKEEPKKQDLNRSVLP